MLQNHSFVGTSFKLLFVLALGVLVVGCNSATNGADESDAEVVTPSPSTSVVETETEANTEVDTSTTPETVTDADTAADTAEVASSSVSSLPTTWTVTPGESLWKISSYFEIYSRGELWPLIFKANSGSIEDPDLIKPNQVLQIPRGSSQNEINTAVRHATTRGAWSVGDIEMVDQEYLYD